MNHVRHVAVTRRRWCRGELQEDARETLGVVGAVRQGAFPDELAVFETEQCRLSEKERTATVTARPMFRGRVRVRAPPYPFVRFDQIDSSAADGDEDVEVAARQPRGQARRDALLDLTAEEGGPAPKVKPSGQTAQPRQPRDARTQKTTRTRSRACSSIVSGSST